MTVGGSFHDTATLSPPAGGPAPTGTVTFDVYGPGDTTCAGPVLFTSTNPLNPAGTSAVSGNFTPTTAGTYRVVATYSGDANYSSRTSRVFRSGGGGRGEQGNGGTSPRRCRRRR